MKVQTIIDHDMTSSNSRQKTGGGGVITTYLIQIPKKIRHLKSAFITKSIKMMLANDDVSSL